MKDSGDYISREAFKQEVRKLSTHYLNEWDTLGVLAAADRIPAADVRPVVRGKWAWNDNNGYYFCDKCGTVSPRENQDGDYIDCPDFCPNCGADMRPEPKEEGE